MNYTLIQLQKKIDELLSENSQLKSLLKQHGILYPKQQIQTETFDVSEEKLSSQDKINLYRSYFKGREDVYAIRWENAKTNRRGYVPACQNEWHRTLCHKPKIKCGACPNQNWKPLTDQVIYSHLKGASFIGLYPLLNNDRCYFVAMDFDKQHWKQDILAVKKVCDKYQISHVIERSQSGNGAHVWIFFKESISANTARSLATAILTAVMQLHPTLSMDSYDRLFPNQDTMPRGGFGNLIALPLQGDRCADGNSTFIQVENNFLPYHNPWKVLQDTRKLALIEVEAILSKIQELTGILDIGHVASEDDDSQPWEKNPNRGGQYPEITEVLPKALEIVKANLLYIPTTSLPAKLVNQIRKIAAFQNPEFYRAQAMRLSTFGKPRIIHCAEIFTNHIGLPRGCEDALVTLCNHYHIHITFDDKRVLGEPINLSFQGELRQEQQKAVDKIMLHEAGVLSARTGFGKTVVAANIIAKRNARVLILVHRQQLLEQWRQRLSCFLDMSEKEIGIAKSGKFKLTGKVDIAMLQSLVKRVNSGDIEQYGHVIVDECHHLSAFSFEKVLRSIKAKYVLGLTATPYRKDGHHPIIFMQCGPIRFQTSKRIEHEQKMIVHVKELTTVGLNDAEGIASLYRSLAENEERNKFILDELIGAYKSKRYPILLTNRTYHLDWFKKRLADNNIKEVYVLKGGMRKKAKDAVMEAIEQSQRNRILLATGSYIGEGYDDAKLDTLFLAMPVAWHGTLQQYLGRLHRKHSEKKAIEVYDYVDINSAICFRMYQKRIKKYKILGYDIDS